MDWGNLVSESVQKSIKTWILFQGTDQFKDQFKFLLFAGRNSPAFLWYIVIHEDWGHPGSFHWFVFWVSFHLLLHLFTLTLDLSVFLLCLFCLSVYLKYSFGPSGMFSLHFFLFSLPILFFHISLYLSLSLLLPLPPHLDLWSPFEFSSCHSDLWPWEI